ncbi:complement resistance protein TraT, partial [Escherichia coli]|uniref:complement resistance protein TraT n=1 Tax=Escherichia coli TaxID=562 RepID=UPI0021E7EE89
MKTKKLMMVALVSSTLALSGCGAMSTAIKKRNLEVKTQMSETIWLEPASERTVFLQIKNTSDKDMNRPGFPGECFICELRLPDQS